METQCRRAKAATVSVPGVENVSGVAAAAAVVKAVRPPLRPANDQAVGSGTTDGVAAWVVTNPWFRMYRAEHSAKPSHRMQ